MIQEITGGHPPRIAACFCETNVYHDPGIISCLNISGYNTYFLLAVLNSRLLSWFHQVSSPKGMRHTFPKVLIGDIRNFPIPLVDLEKADEKALHNLIVRSVEQIMDAKPKLAQAANERDRQLCVHAGQTHLRLSSLAA